MDDEGEHDLADRTEAGQLQMPLDDQQVPIAPKDMVVTCADCGGRMTLRNSKYGLFWGCENYWTTGCRGTHAAHPDGRPMGRPATAYTKRLRMQAHDAFDKLWRGPQAVMKRDAAYRWMQREMGMTEEQAHIGMFGPRECEALIQKVAEFWEQQTTRRQEFEALSPKEQELQHMRDVAAKQMRRLYKGPGATMTRNEAYRFMNEKLGGSNIEHIGELNLSQCKKLVSYIGNYLKELRSV